MPQQVLDTPAAPRPGADPALPERRRPKDLIARHVAVPLIDWLIRLTVLTQRCRFMGIEHFNAAVRTERPILWAFWHHDIISIAMAYLRLKPNRELAVLCSRSRDGDVLAGVITRFGMIPIRASSSRGALRGSLEILTRWKGRGGIPGTVAIAIDGPRGPRHVAKPGSALLARKAGALIVPVAFSHTREFQFRSWDRMRLPKFFTKTVCAFGAPIDSATWDEEQHNLGPILDTLREIADRETENRHPGQIRTVDAAQPTFL